MDELSIMIEGNVQKTSVSTRREFIKFSAAGSAIVLAGCTSSEDSNDLQFRVFDPTTDATSHTDRHLNPFNPSRSGCWHPGANVFDQPVLYSKTNNELYPLIVTDWEKSDETALDVMFSDQWTWHNGDQVVAQDWATQLQIALELQRFATEDGNRPNQIIESVEVVDDQLLRFHLYDSFTPTYVFRTWLEGSLGDNSRGIYVKHDEEPWNGWLDSLRTAQGDEKKSIIGEITEANTPILDSNIVGNGPFRITKVGDTETIMETYNDHPNADNINFDAYSLNLFANTQDPVQAYSTDQVDAAHSGFPVSDDVENQLPEGHTLINESRSSNKLFAFNCGHDVEYDTPFESVNVRKAVSHIFDQQQVTQLLQGVNRLFEWPPCRIPAKILRDGSHPAVEWVKDFTQYGQNDTDRATELLQKEGYERDDNGDWLTPDGDRFEISIMNATERSDIQVLTQNLKEFGIATNQEQVDQATFDERRQNGEYHMISDVSGADGVTTMWASGLVLEWLPSILHFSPETEIPMPIGDPEGTSGTKEIDLTTHIHQWQISGKEQYHKELMWWWNQTIPEIEMMYEPNAGAYNASNWNIDVVDEGIRDLLYAAPKMEDGTIEYTDN